MDTQKRPNQRRARPSSWSAKMHAHSELYLYEVCSAQLATTVIDAGDGSDFPMAVAIVSRNCETRAGRVRAPPWPCSCSSLAPPVSASARTASCSRRDRRGYRFDQSVDFDLRSPRPILLLPCCLHLDSSSPALIWRADVGRTVDRSLPSPPGNGRSKSAFSVQERKRFGCAPSRKPFALLALVLFWGVGAFAQQPTPYLPDPGLTPGDVFDVTIADICAPGYAKKVRSVPKARRDQAFERYGITFQQRTDYQLDHLSAANVRFRCARRGNAGNGAKSRASTPRRRRKRIKRCYYQL